jgi:hypothetical protein
MIVSRTTTVPISVTVFTLSGGSRGGPAPEEEEQAAQQDQACS